MTAREYLEGVSSALRAAEAATLAAEVGDCRGAGGRSDPLSGGPTESRALALVVASARARQAEALARECRARIGGLRLLFARKADALELRYLDGLSWAGVAGRLGVSRRTAIAWRDELCDWVDAHGWARAREGVGGAEG